MRAKVISFINLKGGVSKTTTCVGTALALSEHYKKKVLVIDMDPQTNASTMLLGEQRWEELDKNGFTISSLFSEIVDHNGQFSLKDSIQKGVGTIKDAPSVDVLPCSIQLVYMQDELYKVWYDSGLQVDPYCILENVIGPGTSSYDYILIDCPPNLGILSLNAIQISDGYVIPAIPDILSTYGVDQIINRLKTFSRNRKLKIKLLGILFTKVKGSSNLHARRQEEMKESGNYQIFDTVIPENNKYAEAAEFLGEMTFRQKWGGSKGVDPFISFAGELIDKINQK